MRRILPLIVLVLSSLNTLYAQYINIGSTKQEVKNIQGEPTSVESYDIVGEEIWRYGETGIATITFKNGKIKGFRNSNGILRIGDNSIVAKSSEKPRSKEELQEKFNKITPEDTKDTSRSITGLYGSGGQSIKTFPKEYAEMAKANGLNPYAMPDDIDLQNMQKEYERKKLIKWVLIGIGTIGILYLLFRIIIKKKQQ
ncbi:hypothetical protein IX39_04400 [Chryseobacterium formosense]|uniref:Uncharacterized protein n=1 Tax=Chryseobacterium formosense TaxID=236814 RepID=A0A085Z636_9FLAO|nr:hypothetical protein [Chryseobacterium formosense]KFE99899.1 hypothetical protein IX39_04400 [Chryseobacterium formosense]SFT59742.1 hypothetical protein SAMN05421857_1964 [Chryseobacterium formosense]